ESKRYSTGGHITPIGLFYIVHALVDAGFSEIEVEIDKRQSTSAFFGAFLYLPIRLIAALADKKEEKKYKTIDESNRFWVKKMNTWDILLGRTLILSAKK
nr:class I SAM-dependent methyltransferase [Ramlibacter sp.]